jgi:signal transduction histidine kinase
MGAYAFPQKEQSQAETAPAAATCEPAHSVPRTERLAHDLCNYLTAISGLAQIGRLVKASEDKDSYLLRIENAVQEMSVMLRDVLTERTCDLREELDPGAIHRLLAEVVDFFRPSCQHKRVVINLKCPAVLPRVRLAPLAFKQAIVNLLDNSLRSTPAGGSVVLTVSASRSPDTIVIRLQDTGTGISKGALAKVQTPGTTTRAEGYGVGLAMAREIVEVLHGGKLTRRNRPGAGTSVRICLPC